MSKQGVEPCKRGILPDVWGPDEWGAAPLPCFTEPRPTVPRLLPLQVSQNYSKHVTHVIASRTDKLEFQAHVRAGRDVVCMDWLAACVGRRQPLPVRPAQYLHLTEPTRKAMPDVDRFGDLCAPPFLSRA